MTPLEAHSHFAARTDRSLGLGEVVEAFCTLPVLRGGRIQFLEHRDCWPIFLACYAQMSGMLDRCQSDADLDEAVFEYVRRWEAGQIDRSETLAAAGRMAEALYRHVDDAQPHLWQ